MIYTKESFFLYEKKANTIKPINKLLIILFYFSWCITNYGNSRGVCV